jgi:transcriptional regulator with XRE-family HTH domain
MSQAEAAKKINIRQPQLSRMENGETLPSDEQLQRIAKLYGIGADELKAQARAASTDVYGETDESIAVSDSISFSEKLHVTRNTFVGSGCRARRSSTSSEKCLGIEEQTAAISAFMRSATGEFCMAVFGRWGRGKTFLLQQVERELQRDRYSVTWFNAWKYRTTPELWAHLYETIVRSITQDKSIRKTALAIRAHLVGAGIWSMLGYALMSYGLMVPFAAVFQILYFAISIVGIGFALYLFRMVRKGQQTWCGFQGRFATLASYQSALGLQAAIGNDLRNVVVGAFPNGYFKKRGVRILLGFVSIMSLAASYGMYRLPELQDSGALPATILLPNLRTWQVLASVAVWWVIFSYFVLCSTLAIPKRRRLLLVVDDLDRCDPKQMLEVIESIKLLIEDEHLDDRIQVVLLVEETLLRQAVFEKVTSYRKSGQDEPSVARLPAHVLVDEHLDKLFLAYYRFPQLRADQLGNAADKFITEQLREIRDELRQKLGVATSAERDEIQHQLTSYDELLSGDAAVTGENATAQDTRNGAEAEPLGVAQGDADADVRTVIEKLSGLVYSQAEKSVLVAAMKTLPERLGQLEYSCGPRAVRLFLYRYQLVRLLLEASNQDTKWPSDELVEAMLLAHEDRVPDSKVDWHDVDPRLRSIVQSVV